MIGPLKIFEIVTYVKAYDHVTFPQALIELGNLDIKLFSAGQPFLW
jgi:hypothetical protein